MSFFFFSFSRMRSINLVMIIITVVSGTPNFDLKGFFTSFYNPQLMNLAPLSRGSRQLETQTVCNVPNGSFEILENVQIAAQHCIVKQSPYINTIDECISECQREALCHSVEITEGVCTLYSISYDDSPGYFTPSTIKGLHVVAQRRCSPPTCGALWETEVVYGYRLDGYIINTLTGVATRSQCTNQCQAQSSCKSVNYNPQSKNCELNSASRQTVVSNEAFVVDTNNFYVENNCVAEPSQICTFERHNNVIPYNFDSFYLNARTEDDCKAKCLADPKG